jgi:hypothetical protein
MGWFSCFWVELPLIIKTSDRSATPIFNYVWDIHQFTFPKFFDGIAEQHPWEQAGEFSFHTLRVAVRTKDSRNGADTNYFQLAVGNIHLRYRAPLVVGNPSFVLLPGSLAPQPQPLNLPNLNKAPAAIIWTSTPSKGFLLWTNSGQ